MVVGARAGPGTARCFGVSFPLLTRSEREQAEEGAELLLRGPSTLQHRLHLKPGAVTGLFPKSEERLFTSARRRVLSSFLKMLILALERDLALTAEGILKSRRMSLFLFSLCFRAFCLFFPWLLPRRPPYSSRVPTHLCRRWAAAFCQSEVSRSLSTHNTNAAGFQQCCF